MTAVAVPQPALAEVGVDLLRVSRRRRWLAFIRPALGVATFAFAVAVGWWYLTPILVFLIFVAVVTATHDVVHGALGLGRRGTDWALFLLGLMLLESGHAYRVSHLRHHRLFPSRADPEGRPAMLSFFGAICYGPIFLPRLWWWALWSRRGRAGWAERSWLLAEGAVAPAALGAGVAAWSVSPALLVYVVMVIVGSWVYPLLTVHLPHRDFGDTPITQTRTLRGRIIPALFLELTYHLEHHLYPQVPSHHLAELSRRLDPYLRAGGARIHRVP
ncbi:MAG: fatty acid desaturase family protein [Frankia sp.]